MKPTMNPLLLEKLFTALTWLGVPPDLLDPIKKFLTSDKSSMTESDAATEAPEEDAIDVNAESPKEDKGEHPDVETPEEEKVDTVPEDKETTADLMHMLNGSSGEKDPSKLLGNMKGIKVICLTK